MLRSAHESSVKHKHGRREKVGPHQDRDDIDRRHHIPANVVMAYTVVAYIVMAYIDVVDSSTSHT